MISIDTLILARKYAGEASQEAIDKAVAEAVTQSKIYTDDAISRFISFDIVIVESLPSDPKEHTIYFVPRSASKKENGYYEYMWVDNKWELIGETTIDIDNYYTKDEIDVLFEQNAYELPVATKDELGGVKVDNTSTVILDENDVLHTNLHAISLTDISSLFS